MPQGAAARSARSERRAPAPSGASVHQARARSAASVKGIPLTRRQMLDMTLPGVAIGILGGVIAGAIAGMGGFSVGWSVIAGAALALPLAAGGGACEILLARGVLAFGPLTPVVLFMAPVYLLSRVIQEVVVALATGSTVGMPYGWGSFLAYQALVSVGFGIGYWWLESNFAARWWWHLRERNPVARRFIEIQIQTAQFVAADRERGRNRRRAAAAEARKGDARKRSRAA